MNIIEKIECNIDKIQDDINFKMLLFNEGKYDKEHLRTIIRNVGLKLSIENKLKTTIIIENLYLGIFNQKKLVKLYSSFQLSTILPKTLNSHEKFSICFYGWNIKEKFEEFENEKGMFIFSTLGSEKTFNSSKFDGDNIEEKLTYLEDDEIANWGSNEFYLFDSETIL
jgi:hypothetical protein